MVVQTVPPAELGTITGTSPLTVHFNLCQSRPVNEDDNLRYSVDFEGDGTVDFYGHCRTDHVYDNPNAATACVPARVCVSDRRPGGEVCETIEVCAESASVEEPPVVEPVPEPEPPSPPAE
jgi:hypothetical protein